MLKAKAKENLNITKKSRSRSGALQNITVKKGNVVDSNNKHNPAFEVSGNAVRVGMSKGVTLNMENYESMRIDCWISDVVGEKETKKEAFDRIGKLLDEVLEEAANSVEQ